MSKLFDTSDYIVDMIGEEFANCGLESYGIALNVLSTVKAKDILTVAKASPTTEKLSNQESLIIVTVFERAFERLDEKAQKLFIESILSCVTYDSEKDKIMIDKNQANMLHRMRHKYDDSILNTLELNQIIISQIEEEDKAKKEEEKLKKMEKRALKNKN